jgi:acyl CoA:acetate/3-ketoacid CoA transferase alpha subunit
MLASVAVALAILAQYAGAWGVPYFTFRTDRGSTCKNDLAGYTCSPMTLADVEYFGDVDLPENSAVVTGTYRATHDYQMQAIIEVPLASADLALTSLNQAFGHCISELPSPLTAKGIRDTCVMANDDVFTESEEPSGRLYLIGTGVRQDGTRVIGMVIKSR